MSIFLAWLYGVGSLLVVVASVVYSISLKKSYKNEDYGENSGNKGTPISNGERYIKIVCK